MTTLPNMKGQSNLQIDEKCLTDLRKSLLLDYGLSICSITATDRTFERALSVCLFGNEEEVESISNTLKSHHDWYWT